MRHRKHARGRAGPSGHHPLGSRACQREAPPPSTSSRRAAARLPRPRRRRAPGCMSRTKPAGTSIVIDPEAGQVVERIAVGKRPRGLRISRDGRQLLVALSGNPIAGPGVDESKLPPADRAADGIGVVDLAHAQADPHHPERAGSGIVRSLARRQDALRVQRRRRADVRRRHGGRHHSTAGRCRGGARRRHDAARRRRSLRDVRGDQRGLRHRYGDRQGRGADEDRCEAAVGCLHGRRRDARS